MLLYPRTFSVRFSDRRRLNISTIDESMVRYVERVVEVLDYQGKSFPEPSIYLSVPYSLEIDRTMQHQYVPSNCTKLLASSEKASEY